MGQEWAAIQEELSQGDTYTVDLYQLLLDDTKVIQNLRMFTPEMVEVVYQLTQEGDPVEVNLNIFVACFTNCWTWLKLYQEGLRPLETLYFDTDSIIYSQKPGQPSLPRRDYLGQFTNESDPGDTLVTIQGIRLHGAEK